MRRRGLESGNWVGVQFCDAALTEGTIFNGPIFRSIFSGQKEQYLEEHREVSRMPVAVR